MATSDFFGPNLKGASYVRENRSISTPWLGGIFRLPFLRTGEKGKAPIQTPVFLGSTEGYGKKSSFKVLDI